MKFAAYSDIGKIRSVNEDGFYISEFADGCGYIIVADGMGGHKGGRVASALALELISKKLNENDSWRKFKEKIKDVLKLSVENANSEIYKRSLKSGELSGMGTTVVLCVFNGKEIHVSNVGDSRLYIISGENILQVTKDHSVVQELIDLGEITQEEGQSHPSKNIITKALGARSSVKPDYFVHEVSEGDVVLLCTDGLSNMLSEEKIVEIINKHSDLDSCAKELIQEANKSGGYDNITVALISIES